MAKNVKVYRRIKGEPLTRVVARTRAAQDGTEHAARIFYSRAKTILAMHHAYGGSEITFAKEGIATWFVGLKDSDTRHDAASTVSNPRYRGEYVIEYGHVNNDPRYGAKGRWVEGASPLRQALDDLGWGADFGKRKTGRGKRA
jgi:hypothetical protein